MSDRTKEALKIMETGKLQIGSKTLDISEMLNRKDKKSVEYRQKDIESIDIGIFRKKDSVCIIDVSPTDSLSARHTDAGKIGILNFASSKNPGGGFMTGALAQEESLCYCTNLYGILSEHKSFYEYNRNHLNKSLYADGIIYSEDVVVFKDRAFTNVKPAYVNIITCAAPNRGAALGVGVPEDEIKRVMYRRLESIMKTAINHNIEHLVLGAFGCGVFLNDPAVVAGLTRELLLDKGYAFYFNRVTFPVMSSKAPNYRPFKNVFSEI